MSVQFITGPVRSGKSRYAESLVRGPAVYLAPGPAADAGDSEWAARVATHRLRRPADWETIETRDLPTVVLTDDPRPVLIDCLGTWVTALIDAAGAWEEPARAREVVADARGKLVTALSATAREVVLVSNEVGWGVVPAYPSGRLFTDVLGEVNAAVADVADTVLLVVVGRVLDLTAAPRVRARDRG